MDDNPSGLVPAASKFQSLWDLSRLFARRMTMTTRTDGSIPDPKSTVSKFNSLPSEIWAKVFASSDFSLEDYRSFTLIEKSTLGPASEKLFEETDLRSRFTGRLARSKRFNSLVRVGYANLYNSDQYRAEWLPHEDRDRGLRLDPLSNDWTPGSKQVTTALSMFSNMSSVVLRHLPFQETTIQTGPTFASAAPKWFFNVLSRLKQVKTLRLFGPVTGISIPGDFFELARLSEPFLRQLETLELGVIWNSPHTPLLLDLDWRITQIIEVMPSLRVLKLHNFLKPPIKSSTRMREAVLPLVQFQLNDFTVSFANLTALSLSYVRFDQFKELTALLACDTLQSISMVGICLTAGNWQNVFDRIRTLCRKQLRRIHFRHLMYQQSIYLAGHLPSFLQANGRICWTWELLTYRWGDIHAIKSLVQTADELNQEGARIDLQFDAALYRSYDPEQAPRTWSITQCRVLSLESHPWFTYPAERGGQAVAMRALFDHDTINNQWLPCVPEDHDDAHEFRGLGPSGAWRWAPLA